MCSPHWFNSEFQNNGTYVSGQGYGKWSGLRLGYLRVRVRVSDKGSGQGYSG
jgi:hypothetical protein